MERKSKTIFQLDSPFSRVEWPEITPEKQDTILELLCSLLSPIGRHRANHVVPSKGKRSKKRKRKETKPEEITPKPALPEISSHVALGLHSITRYLESSSTVSKPGQAPSEESPNEKDAQGQIIENRHFSAIFTIQPAQTTILHTHLPLLVATASKAHPNLPPTRLVSLPPGCAARLNEAVGLPRVSMIGLLDGAPHSQALVDLIRESISEIEVPWLEGPSRAEYLPVKINAIETFVTVGKAKV